MTIDYSTVTETVGDLVSSEQIERIANRYYWALPFCEDKKTIELACGTGQGLKLLRECSSDLKASDIDSNLANTASQNNPDIEIGCYNACEMPIGNSCVDTIILFEAIYYLPDINTFLEECKRVLASHGVILMSFPNKDLFDFTPSPHSHKYFNPKELSPILEKHGFKACFFADFPTTDVSFRQKLLRPIKALATRLNLIPKSMDGKKLLKKIFFGRMEPMPDQISLNTAPKRVPQTLSFSQIDHTHKVIYCHAQLND